MIMAAQKREVNLLLAKSLQTNTLGRMLAWILSSFRIIVIVTEIIVMIAFLSRFWLDAQNSDLNEDLKNKTRIIEESEGFIQEFKDVQNRLVIAGLIVSQGSYSQIVKDITPLLPKNLYLTQISLSNDGLNLSGSSLESVAIHQFVINLHASNLFSQVGLQEITSDKDVDLLNFKIIIKTK